MLYEASGANVIFRAERETRGREKRKKIFFSSLRLALRARVALRAKYRVIATKWVGQKQKGEGKEKYFSFLLVPFPLKIHPTWEHYKLLLRRRKSLSARRRLNYRLMLLKLSLMATSTNVHKVLLIYIIIHQIFSLARDWSKRITWANIPQPKLGNIRGYSPIFKTDG